MIEAQHLVKRFGLETLALDDVSFVVSAGEIYCLLGGPGAGRTTIVNLLLGAIEPTSGRLLLGGVDLLKHRQQARGLATFVTGGGSLYDVMTARRNVEFFARLGGALVANQRQTVENA